MGKAIPYMTPFNMLPGLTDQSDEGGFAVFSIYCPIGAFAERALSTWQGFPREAAYLDLESQSARRDSRARRRPADGLGEVPRALPERRFIPFPITALTYPLSKFYRRL